ncbi:hypothetical protein P9112_011117 [Eukaryota sp. TZLM1-RC]
MHLKFRQSVVQGDEKTSPISGVSWSPDNKRLAVAYNNTIHLFDDNLEWRDKFSTRPGDKKTHRPYTIRDIAFSPDYSRIAVAQTDCSLFVYRIGTDWDDRKSICNKFLLSSPVASMYWPSASPSLLFFSTLDGSIRMGHLKTNKDTQLFKHDFPATCITFSTDGLVLLTAHMDGSLHRFTFDSHLKSASHVQLPKLSFAPRSLAAGIETWLVLDDHCNVSIISNSGSVIQSLSSNSSRQFTCFSLSPSKTTLLVGSFESVLVYVYNERRSLWTLKQTINIPNYKSITSIKWKPDSSRVALATFSGFVDVYEACLRRIFLKQGRFELTFISSTSVIVKITSSGERLQLSTSFGSEITNIKIFKDRFLVARTAESLLLADLLTKSCSELPWNTNINEEEDDQDQSTQERFIFEEDSGMAMIFLSGELMFVEIGQNDVALTVRTEKVNQHVISTAFNNRLNSKNHIPKRRIAHLIDSYTISVLDLTLNDGSGSSTTQVCSFSHQEVIDFVELNCFSDKLLFRDRMGNLFIAYLESNSADDSFVFNEVDIQLLLTSCHYVQWVPQSDVIVAQSDAKLSVWYDSNTPSKNATIDITGELVDIERNSGKTEVVVEEGHSQVSYVLDESLIEFSSAMRRGNLVNAMQCIEDLVLDSQVEGLWLRLLNECIHHGKLSLAIRCCSVLGDVSKVEYLNSLMELGQENFDCRSTARLSLLTGDTETAESVLLSQGLIDEAIDLFQSIGLDNIALSIAQKANHPSFSSIKSETIRYYVDSGQEALAAQIKENENDFVGAINLYIKGRQPSKAADLMFSRNLFYQSQTLDMVIAALCEVKDFKKCGELLEKAERFNEAIDYFIKGNFYEPAVSLAKLYDSSLVEDLTIEWGVYLLENHQPSAASGLFSEVGLYLLASYAEHKAGNIDMALDYLTKQTQKQLPSNYSFVTKQYILVSIAENLESRRDYSRAERLYSNAGVPEKAVEMYTRLCLWTEAFRSALQYMNEGEVVSLYVEHANNLVVAGKLAEAEKLYIAINQVDLAIEMYRVHHQFDSMIRLVKIYRKDLLNETYIAIGQKLESMSDIEGAIKHYLEAKQWKLAVATLKVNKQWEKALALAKLHGGSSAGKVVAYHWAEEKGGQEGVDLLLKHGYVDQAIDFCLNNEMESLAVSVAEKYSPATINKVYVSLAGTAVKRGDLATAESFFVKGGCIKEAIDVYIDQNDWQSANRVAETHQSNLIDYVRERQSRSRLTSRPATANNHIFRPSTASKPLNLVSESQLSHLISEPQHKGNRQPLHEFSTIEELCKQGNWNKGQVLAEEQGPEAMKVFGFYYSKFLFDSNKINDCLDIASRYELCLGQEAVDFVKGLSILILSCPQNSPFNDVEIVSTLRKVVLNLWLISFATGQHSDLSIQIEELLWMVNFYCRGLECRHLELFDLSAKLFTSLLRYNGTLPSDKLFLEAGLACKLANQTNAAWVFLDKYIDIVEAIEEESDYIEGCNLVSTDIPLENVTMPRNHYAPSSVRENQRQYVLTMSMAEEVHSEPNTRPCPHCGQEIYEARMSCPYCEAQFSPCAASGFPLSITSEKHQCRECKKESGIADLNSWVSRTKKCPFCDCFSAPSY